MFFPLRPSARLVWLVTLSCFGRMIGLFDVFRFVRGGGGKTSRCANKDYTVATTKEWAKSLGICADDSVPPIDDYTEPYGRRSDEIAMRCVILHAAAAVGYGVDGASVIDWLQAQDVWQHVSPQEAAFLLSPSSSESDRIWFQWRQESQWALLWCIGKIDLLGLPTRCCDTRRLVDEVMPGLGDDVHSFSSTSTLRPPSELLGEDDRTYNLYCYALKADPAGQLPEDLNLQVLYQRRYAFEWLNGDNWDDVEIDA